jgi:hypothetical protein
VNTFSKLHFFNLFFYDLTFLKEKYWNAAMKIENYQVAILVPGDKNQYDTGCRGCALLLSLLKGN